MELSESQVMAEIANARRDIESRLNALEHRIGRPVLNIQLRDLDITTVESDRRRCVRVVQIDVAKSIGQIGKS